MVCNVLSSEYIIISFTMFYKRAGGLRTVKNLQDCRRVLFTMNNVAYYRGSNGYLIKISLKILQSCKVNRKKSLSKRKIKQHI